MKYIRQKDKLQTSKRIIFKHRKCKVDENIENQSIENNKTKEEKD